MAQLFGSGGVQIKSESGGHNGVWSDEHDCIPLKQRLKILLASKRLSDFSDSESDKGSKIPSIPPTDVVVVEKEDQQCDLQVSNPGCFAQGERNQKLSPDQSHAGVIREYSCQETEVNERVSLNRIRVNADTVLVEKINACSRTLAQCSMLSKYPVKVEVDYADNNLTSSPGNDVVSSLDTDLQAVKIKTEIASDFEEDLDHIVLKERQRLLLSRRSLELRKPVMEESLVAGNHPDDVPKRTAHVFCKTSKSGSSNGIIAGSSCAVVQCSALVRSCQNTKSATSGVMGIQESDRVCLSKKASTINESCGGPDFVCANPHSIPSSVLSSTAVNIKAEPLDHGDVHSLEKDSICNFLSNSIRPMKSELEIAGESYGDKLDHMLLRDRIKLLASREATNLDYSRKLKCSKRIVPPGLDRSSVAAESSKPLKINRPRKRRKTATDSVEKALEEDAPGLLQVLIGKGVSINEIKLYGQTESDEALADSLGEDCFSELEAVISKLFLQRESLLKFAPIRCAKDEKASYCLACLISLVEQARYLQFRKWPAEWGWCRDLQSFIFVFERHNRIVLERPEYGYATYFFELVDALPIDWQIKRLVTAMKLTNCSRITLIENKALLVGEDLTESEARVLTEYGWTPNTGLGTMLNYCDRVVHDRKNERDSSEWRSKISKLLMNGYNGGTIATTDIPKKVIEYNGGQDPQIKLEI
ncbi:uncharacterized protein LOC130785188 isoform X2 [Actinidia eriantha]|uniref:uncharacterized protein LOC130785188 isoform X2 n=1 Tax=Actinidia eriantha TaxID=165200 RepID=UPI00258B0E7B|nr:uncharacterized protein LOC130785188 isoform X2 [Actinidia eriantha]